MTVSGPSAAVGAAAFRSRRRLSRPADGANTAAHSLASPLDGLAGRVRQIVRTVPDIAAGLVPAHGRKQNAQSDADSQSDQEALHHPSPRYLVGTTRLGYKDAPSRRGLLPNCGATLENSAVAQVLLESPACYTNPLC